MVNEGEDQKIHHQTIPAHRKFPNLYQPVQSTPPLSDPKQRTPPSLEKEPISKKLILEMQNPENPDDPINPEVPQNGGGAEPNPGNPGIEPELEKVENLTELNKMMMAMEARIITSVTEKVTQQITANLTNTFEGMLKPLQNNITTLFTASKEWEVQKIEVSKLAKLNVNLNQRIQKLELKNNDLSTQVKNIESRLMEKNIIFQGVRDQQWESDSTCREEIAKQFAHTIQRGTYKESLDIAKTVKIKSVSRIGIYNALKTRPIKVEFNNKVDIDHLLYNRKRLPEGVFVDKEYTDEVSQTRRLLRPILKLARSIDHYKGKCKMVDDYLVILGKKYTRENLNQLPDDLSEFLATSNTNPSTFCFFGELSPFSNFHSSTFDYKGTQFHSSEQLIQYKKAELFHDNRTITNILRSTSAIECKRLSKEIVGYNHDHWIANAKELCTPGLTEKFVQNQNLADLLIGTGDKKIAEACRDTIWGTGITLNHDNCLKQEHWKNQGLLGEILEDIRNKLIRRVEQNNMEIT